MGAGVHGTGIQVSTGRYPHINFIRVSALMTVGTSWANQIQTGIHMIGKDLYNARAPSFSTLASFIFNLTYATGSIRYPRHSQIVCAAASLHHNKLHAGDHIGDSLTWHTVAAVTTYVYSRPAVTGGNIYMISDRYLVVSGDRGKTWRRIIEFSGYTYGPPS